MIKAYYSTVTEYESGWGSRLDGYLIAKNLEDFKEKEAQIESVGSYDCYSRVDSEPIEVLLEDDNFFDVHTKAVWTGVKPKMFKAI